MVNGLHSLLGCVFCLPTHRHDRLANPSDIFPPSQETYTSLSLLKAQTPQTYVGGSAGQGWAAYKDQPAHTALVLTLASGSRADDVNLPNCCCFEDIILHQSSTQGFEKIKVVLDNASRFSFVQIKMKGDASLRADDGKPRLASVWSQLEVQLWYYTCAV